MNLELCQKLLEGFLKEVFKKVKYSLKDDHLAIVIENVGLDGIDDDIHIEIGAFSSGSSYVEFILDKVNPCDEFYKNISKFNDVNTFLKAFVHERGFLVVDNCVPFNSDEEGFMNNVEYIINTFADPKTIEQLKELTKFTSKPLN